MVDRDLVRRKLAALDEYVAQLGEYRTLTADGYRRDWRTQRIVERTRQGGAEIVGLLKTGSAFYAPSAAVVQMVDAILLDEKRILPCAAYLDGEYGIRGVFVGVPVKLGASGIEEIVQIGLTREEEEALKKSAQSVQELADVMHRARV